MIRPSIYITVFLLMMTLNVTGQDTVIHDLAWSPDGSKIALAKSDGLTVIDSQTGSSLAGFQINEDTRSVSWSPDGTKLLSGRRDGVVDVWDGTNGQSITTFVAHQSFIEGISPRLSNVKWSPDSNLIVTIADSIDIPATLSIWNGQTLELQASFNASALADVQWSLDSSKIFVANSIEGAYAFDATLANVTEYNINDFHIGYHDRSISIAVNPSETQIAVGSALAQQKNINIWDTASGLPLHFLEGHIDLVYGLSWHPTNARLASASLDGTLRVWDTVSGQQVDIINVGEPVYTVAWSPDGTKLAYGNSNGTVEIVDTLAVSCDINVVTADTARQISAISSTNGDPNATTSCSDE